MLHFAGDNRQARRPDERRTWIHWSASMSTEPPLHVLAVDDEVAMLRTIRRALTAFGFTVEMVTAGAEAVEKAKLKRYDAYTVDMKMEPRDGLWTCRELLRVDPGAVVIIVSGEAEADVRIAALKAGAEDYVLKPFIPEELALRIRKRVRKQG